jgi:hypothetical protein
MKHDDDPNWKEELTRCLAVAPDWELRMSNHTVAVSDFHEFHITWGGVGKSEKRSQMELAHGFLDEQGGEGGVSPDEVRDINNLKIRS